MRGETDLNAILAGLTVTRRAGTFTFVSAQEPVMWDQAIHALVREREGTTVIITADGARARGWDIDFEGAWLTLDVHSSLSAVGLTAAVSEALAAESIPCNIVAGYYHDHLLVPSAQADRAIAAIERLGRRSPEGRR